MQTSIHLAPVDILGNLNVVASPCVTNCYTCMPNEQSIYCLIPINDCCMAIGTEIKNVLFDVNVIPNYYLGSEEINFRRLNFDQSAIVSKYDMETFQNINYSIMPVETIIGQRDSIVKLDGGPFVVFLDSGNKNICKLIAPIPMSQFCHVLAIPAGLCEPIDQDVLKQINSHRPTFSAVNNN